MLKEEKKEDRTALNDAIGDLSPRDVYDLCWEEENKNPTREGAAWK